MAITRGATTTPRVDTTAPIIATGSHTVNASTTLLVVTFHCEGDLGISSVNWNTSEAMTAITSVVTSSAGGDCRVYAFGRVNPTAATANITWTVTGAGDNLAVVAVNYLGTETASVADATNVINTVDNGNAASQTVALSGVTTNGSTLVAAGTFYGGDGNPSSDTGASFNTVREGETGTSATTDTCYYYGDLIGGGTGGTVSPTIDWTGAISDECVGVFFEIIPAAGPVTIVPGVGAIAVLGYAPSLVINPFVPDVAALTIAGLAPKLDLAISPPVGEVLIHTAGPSVFDETGVNTGGGGPGLMLPFGLNLVSEPPVEIPVPVGAIAVLGYAPTHDIGIPCGVGAVDVLGYAPTLVCDKMLSPPAGEIAVLGYAPTLFVDKAITPPVGAIDVLGYAPTFVADKAISPPVGAIAALGYAPTNDLAIIPPVGAIAALGYAPALGLDSIISPPAGAIDALGYAPSFIAGAFMRPAQAELVIAGYSATLNFTYSPDVGAITVTGLAPTFIAGQFIQPGAGTLTIAGLAPVLSLTMPQAVGALTLTGLAPTILAGGVLSPPAGSAVFGGLAPTTALQLTIPVPVGTATITGYAPTIVVPSAGGGGGPGLSLVFGLNLQVINYTFSPPAGTIEITELAPSFGAGYSYTTGVGAVTIAGYSPSVSTAEGSQAPVLPAPTALAITTYAPVVAAGKRVTFPFLASAEGFVDSAGNGTKVWTAAEGNPPGCLSWSLDGYGRGAGNTWTLTTDWASLGIPADTVITGISLASVDTNPLIDINANGTFKQSLLTPTAYPPIELAPEFNWSTDGPGWVTSSGAGATGLTIPSGGSLTITVGSTLVTPASGGLFPEHVALHDNITFVVSYVAAKSISPANAVATITGHAPTVTALAAQFEQPSAGSLSIQGQGPSVQVVQGVSGGGGGPGLLLALGLNLESVPLGAANLVITGHAPTISRPITLGGSDDLLSARATIVGTGNLIIVGGSTIESPPNGALAVTGLAPTLIETGARNFAMPVTALTFTSYVPTSGISHVVVPGVGSIIASGFGPSVEPNYTVSSGPGSLTITGFVPLALASTTIEVGAGSLTVQGVAPQLVLAQPIVVPVGSATIETFAPLIKLTTLDGTGALASQRATLSASAQVIRRGSGALQSQAPLLFAGTGTRNSTVTGNMRSGPASLSGSIRSVSSVLVSSRATLKARAKVIRFKPSKRPKPQRVNRYTVQLKPNKRHRVGNPNRRRPFK